MGLLDQFTNDPQQAGLLGAAMQMLAASGPSTTPTSFGQVLARGWGGFQQGQQAAMQNQLYGMKLKDAESDLAAQEAKRQREQELAKFLKGYGKDATIPARAVLGSNLAPTVDNAQAIASAPQGQPGIYQQRIDLADSLRRAGFAPEADAMEERALKFQPKVKGWEKVQQGGKVMFAPFFEDGTSGAPVPLEVAEKLEKVNRGGSTELVNPFTGTVAAAFKNTVSPDTVYSGSITMRGQDMADRRAKETMLAGKIPQGYRATANGTLEPIPGGPADPQASKEGVQRKQDANDVLGLLDMATPLVKQSTGSYLGMVGDMGARLVGASTDGGKAAAQLKAIEGALVAKMPKMSGPQSDKDVLLYRQMAGQIGDPTVPADNKIAAMDVIRQINQRHAGGQAEAPTAKVATLADIAETARKSGKSTAEVTQRLRELGYTIKGQ